MEKFKFGQFDNSVDATVFTTANGYGETDGEETTRRQFSYPLKELQDYINNNVNVTLNGVPVMLRITEQGLFQYSTDGKVWRDTVDKNLEARLNEEILRATTKEGEIDTKVTTVEGNLSTVSSTLSQHKGDRSNPHYVTKSQVGLGNVDNTSDLNKPISDAQATVNTTLTTRIANEETRAKGAESNISLSVSTEKNRAEGAERILSQSIREEETRAKAKELSIEINATSLENRLTNVSNIFSAFSNETKSELSNIKGDISNIKMSYAWFDEDGYLQIGE